LSFGGTSTLDYRLVEEVEPQVVVTEMLERFMISIPCDSNAPTVAEMAAQKMADGIAISDRYFARYWKVRS
jgi:hypothetical protein